MAEFLTTRKILSHIEDIIENAKKQLVLVSPFIQISPDIQVRLRNASERGVKIVLIHKKELSQEEAGFLLELQNLEIFSFEFLHAKCYFNESSMVITSMNLYDYSSKNIEIGIHADRKNDREIFDKCIKEIQSLRFSSTKINLNKRFDGAFLDEDDIALLEESEEETDEDGYCIRCGEPIDYDKSRPFCPDCFYEWNQWKNYNFQESFCHQCGDECSTSRSRPLCDHCYYD